MFVTKREIEEYLDEVKHSIRAGRYTIAPRAKNEQIETDYVIGEKKKEEILLSLEAEDFSCVLHNEHPFKKTAPHDGGKSHDKDR